MERLLAASQERNCPVFAAMKHAGVQAAFVPRDARGASRLLSNLIERHQAVLRGGPLSLRQWAENFLEEIDYEAELRRGEKNPEAADNRVRNLRELLATLGDDRRQHRRAGGGFSG